MSTTDSATPFLIHESLETMDKKNLKIVFLGTPEFAVESLDRMLSLGYDVRAVVTMPDKAAGRGHKLLQSDVKKYALQKGLDILQPTNLKDPEFLDKLRSYEADLFVVIAFRMLPEVVWRMPRFGTFNLHASLLPRYRGAAPINRAVMNGDSRTGVTTFFLKHDIDTGDIIAQKAIDIAPDEDAGSVHDRLMRLGADMVAETLDMIVASDGNISTVPQPEGEFIPAPKIFAQDCIIDWTQTCEKVRNQIRGLAPYPAARTFISDVKGNTLSLKVFASCKAELPDLVDANPGDISFDRRRIYVRCSDGVLALNEVQLQGKKRMPTEAFLLGYHPAPGQNLIANTPE